MSSTLDPEPRIRANSESRVHFKEAQITPDHTGEIIVNKTKPNVFEAHIGFLQEKRKYSVSFAIPRYLGDEVSLEETVNNISIDSFKADHAKKKHVIALEIIVDCEGPTEKILKLKGSDETQFVIKMSFTAIGVRKGTPSLKRGVHCIGHEDLDSDVSEMSMEATS